MNDDYIIECNGLKYQLDKEYWEVEYKKSGMLIDDINFQFSQLLFARQTKDFGTLQNRLTNMTTWNGASIIK